MLNRTLLRAALFVGLALAGCGTAPKTETLHASDLRPYFPPGDHTWRYVWSDPKRNILLDSSSTERPESYIPRHAPGAHVMVGMDGHYYCSAVFGSGLDSSR